MESYLRAQHRRWYDFLMDALVEGGVMKRLDLAITIWQESWIFQSWQRNVTMKNVFPYSAASRATTVVSWWEAMNKINTVWEIHFILVRLNRRFISVSMKRTMNSMSNTISHWRYKNQEPFWNPTEKWAILLWGVWPADLLWRRTYRFWYYQPLYMRFADKEVEKRRSQWKTNEKWAYFIGSDRGRLKLTTKPEPYTLTRTLNWISRQVAPTWKESCSG